jgi:hypothetical protein
MTKKRRCIISIRSSREKRLKGRKKIIVKWAITFQKIIRKELTKKMLYI